MKRLGITVLVFAASWLLCGFTLFGGDISDAKKVTVPLENKRIEAGSLIDGYKYFKSVKWAEEKQDDGSIVITATAEYDAKLHFSDRETMVSRNVSGAKNTEILEWINANLASGQSIAPVYVKFYFSRYTDSAMQRDYIARVYANMPHVRDEIFQKMKNKEMSISPFYEIIFAQNPYAAKESVPYKHPSPGSLFSLEALGEMLQQKPISEIGDGSYSIFLDYERHSKAENERMQAEELGKLKLEMSQALSKLPSQPDGLFTICHSEGAMPGYIAGSVYTLESIRLDINPAHREAYVEDEAVMSIWHFSVPVGQDDFKNSLKSQGTGSKHYPLSNIQQEAPGSYSAGWKADGVNFTLRWNEGGYDLFWKDGQRVELKEILNPQEAFINACVPKTETKTFTGTLAANEDSTVFYLLAPDSGSRLVEFDKSTPNIYELLQSRAPKLGAKFTIDFAVSKDTQAVIRLIKAREIVSGSFSLDSLDESRRLREEEAQKEYDYYFNLHQGKDKRELGALYHKTRNQNERRAISALLKLL